MCELPAVRYHGEYEPQLLSDGWVNAEVRFRSNGMARNRIEIINIETQERYPQEPLQMISLKCLGLFLLVSPIYFLFYSAVQMIRILIVPIVNVSPIAFFKEVWHIVKIPFYFIGMQFAALYGVFRPLQGRALFAKYESELHDGKTRREGEQYLKQERLFSEQAWDALFVEEPERALFIGFCMQPLGRVDDPHIIEVRILPTV